jgi:hypothetical protein
MRYRGDIFYLISGVLLLATAAVKLVSMFSHAKILGAHDLIFFFLTTRYLLFIVAMFELLLGSILIFSRSGLIRWLSLGLVCECFWFYRLAIFFVDPEKPCSCLGTIFDWSPWMRAHGQQIALGILIYLTLCLVVFIPSFQSGRNLPGRQVSAGN